MNRHVVTVTHTVTKVQHLTEEQMTALGPDWTILEVDDIECIGRCENCQRPILEGSMHAAYSDGVYTCLNNGCDQPEDTQ